MCEMPVQPCLRHLQTSNSKPNAETLRLVHFLPPGDVAAAPSRSDAARRAKENKSDLVPIRENLVGFLHFLSGAFKMEFQFSGSSSYLDGNGGESVAFHTQLKLFACFVWTVLLETNHS